METPVEEHERRLLGAVAEMEYRALRYRDDDANAYIMYEYVKYPLECASRIELPPGEVDKLRELLGRHLTLTHSYTETAAVLKAEMFAGLRRMSGTAAKEKSTNGCPHEQLAISKVGIAHRRADGNMSQVYFESTAPVEQYSRASVLLPSTTLHLLVPTALTGQ